MNQQKGRRLKAGLAGALALLLALGRPGMALAQQDAGAPPPPPTFQPEELEQLVAPIALYPDSLLAQVLMASTYPLELVEAARWQHANTSLTGKALDDALQQQNWDPSVKSVVYFPQVITMMNDKLDWTQKLGDAFLAQQSDVMDAVQRLRAKAQSEGNLQTTKQQTVVLEPPPAPSQPPIIQIVPADPQVVYVPTYNPTVVYGAWPYPSYPPYYYYPPGYVATASILSFGAGLAVGAALWGGCNWGWGGHSNVNVNYNTYNNFTRNVTNNANRNQVQNRYQNGNWQHDSGHRRGVQYRDSSTQQRFNQTTRAGADSREAFRGRAEQGRQQISREGVGNVQRDLANRGGATGNFNRGAGGGTGEAVNRGGGKGGANFGNRGGAEGNVANRGSGAGNAANRGTSGGSQGGNLGGAAGNVANRGSAGTSQSGNLGGAQRAGLGENQRAATQGLSANRGAAPNPARADQASRSNAFSGIGNGNQVRRDATRGSASRQSASSFGASQGGNRGGGGGGSRAAVGGGGGGSRAAIGGGGGGSHAPAGGGGGRSAAGGGGRAGGKGGRNR